MRALPVALVLSLAAACAERPRSPLDEAALQRACAGLPDSVIDQGVAELRSNFDGASSLREGDGRKALPTLVGAIVEVRAAPGMTAQWLGRMLRCDTARHADAALVPAGARTDVAATPTGFTISIRSSDIELARDIDARAARFAKPEPAKCNTPEYHWNEARNVGGPGHCASDCDCDGVRTCFENSCRGLPR